jgi:hypothetical protein
MKSNYFAFVLFTATLYCCTTSNQESMPVNNQDTLVFAPGFISNLNYLGT